MNGAPQTPPPPPQIEVVEVRAEDVTVPKGTFHAVYARLRDVKANTFSEVWLTGAQIPLGGLAKGTAPTAGGTVVSELTDFTKN